MKTGGRFETQVFYIEAMNLFLTIDYAARPNPNCWVMVKRLTAETIVIERFDGQPYLGVVNVLEFYRLPQSEQGNAGLFRACAD